MILVYAKVAGSGGEWWGREHWLDLQMTEQSMLKMHLFPLWICHFLLAIFYFIYLLDRHKSLSYSQATNGVAPHDR